MASDAGYNSVLVPDRRSASRLPDLGRRGEGWVALQIALLLAVVVAGLSGPPWPPGVRSVARPVGVVIVAAGAVLVLTGSRALGPSLTAVPRPSHDASFRGEGVYRLVRHPIYGGVMLVALGGALLSSPVALVPTGLLALVFEGKRVREESWLLDRYPEYDAYREQVRRRFLPYVW